MSAAFCYLLILTFSLPLKVAFFGVSVHFGELVLMALLVLLVVRYCSSEKKFNVLSSELKFVAIVASFLMLVFLSIVLNDVQGVSLVGFIRLFVAFAFSLLSARYFFKYVSQKTILSAVFISGFILSLYIIFDRFLIKSFIIRPGDLVLGGGVGFIPAAAFLALIVGDFGRIMKCSSGVIIVAALFINGTKAWVLGMLLSLVLALVMRLYREKKKRDAALCFFAFLLILVFAIFVDEVVAFIPDERFSQLANIARFQFEGTTVGSRFYKWELALSQIKESPYFGVGYFNLNLGMPEWLGEEANTRSDSLYMDIFVMSGVLAGALYFIGMMFLYCKHLFAETRSKLTDFVTLVMGLMVFSAFFWSLFGGYMVYFYGFLMGLSFRSYIDISVKKHHLRRVNINEF